MILTLLIYPAFFTLGAVALGIALVSLTESLFIFFAENRGEGTLLVGERGGEVVVERPIHTSITGLGRWAGGAGFDTVLAERGASAPRLKPTTAALAKALGVEVSPGDKLYAWAYRQKRAFMSRLTAFYGLLWLGGVTLGSWALGWIAFALIVSVCVRTRPRRGIYLWVILGDTAQWGQVEAQSYADAEVQIAKKFWGPGMKDVFIFRQTLLKKAKVHAPSLAKQQG